MRRQALDAAGSMMTVNRSFLPILATLTLLCANAGGQVPSIPDTSRELAVGELLPDLEMVTQDGKKTQLSAFRGQPLAATFIYSRCGSAALCPLVSRNFDTAQTLLTRLGAAGQCRLLSISLDAENDTPAVLAAYAKNCEADERFWIFAVAPEEELRRLGSSVGLEFKRIDGRIDHNLRTIVIDSAGRLRRIFRGNTWTPQELVAELRGAMPPQR